MWEQNVRRLFIQANSKKPFLGTLTVEKREHRLQMKKVTNLILDTHI